MGPHAQTRHPQQMLRDMWAFADAVLDFVRDKIPKNWRNFRDSVTDNFRVISPKDFRVLT
jgi:hypothetical protein